MWSMYLISSIIFSHFLSIIFKKYYLAVFIVVLVLMLTPTQIGSSDNSLSPAIFTFFFNIVFEKDYSLRVLRPLFLSLPLSIILVSFIIYLKRRFFPLKD